MKLIAIDLDGTLLSTEHNISERNREAIKKAQNEGNVVVLSSGRSLVDVKGIMGKFNFDCPIIAGNGGISSYKGKLVHYNKLDGKTVQNLTAILEKLNVYYEMYVENEILNFPNKEAILHEEEEKLQTGKLEYTLFEQHGQIGSTYLEEGYSLDFDAIGVYKIYAFSFEEEKIAALKAELETFSNISLDTSGKGKLEIAAANTNKGTGLATLARHLEIPLENTVAIGDNFNDLSMITLAGIGIAMGNAEDGVKEKADYVTLTNNEDGVAYAFENYIFSSEAVAK